MRKKLLFVLCSAIILIGAALLIRKYNENTTAPIAQNDTLVAYFSATGNTRKVAELIAAETGADIYEIVATPTYSAEDIDYRNPNSRASLENANPDALPAIAPAFVNMAQYKTIYLGYPIWWGNAPKIMKTFLTSYDLTEKTIIPFCTSGTSGLGDSDKNLQPLAPNAKWLAGTKFESTATAEDIATRLNELNAK
jgi:flavodoxin